MHHLSIPSATPGHLASQPALDAVVAWPPRATMAVAGAALALSATSFIGPSLGWAAGKVPAGSTPVDASGPADLAADTSATCDRQLTLHNGSRRGITIELSGITTELSGITTELSGITPRVLGAGTSVRLCTSAAAIAWTVRTSDWLYRGVTPLAEGERRRVELGAPGANLVVVNRTGEAQAVSLDGSQLGTVLPGEALTLGPVAAGVRSLTTKSLRSTETYGAEVGLNPGATLRVVLPAPKGLIRLQNPLDEVANLSVDGHLFGGAEPEQRLTVFGLPPGGHEVRWVGSISGKVAYEVAMADDPSDQRSARVRVVVDNRTGEDLEMPAGLRDIGTLVPAKAKDSWSLPRGEYGVMLTGVRSGLTYRLDIHRKGPPDLKWLIRRPTATLRLVNRSGEPMEVDVPTLGPLRMPAEGSATLRVPAGRLSLTARWPGRPHMHKKLFLPGGQEATWSIAARETWILVHSSWAQPVQLYVDGRLTGSIRPHSDFRVPLVPGAHDLQARVPHLGWRERVAVAVRDGDQRELHFDPPSGAARLDNHRAETVEFWVDGALAGAARAGEALLVAVGPGHVHAQVRVEDKDRGESRNLVAAPTQQVQVQGPASQLVRVTFAQRAGRPLTVQLDGRPPAELKDGQEWDAGDLPVGEHLVRVLSPGSTDAKADVRARLVLDGSKPTLRVELRSR